MRLPHESDTNMDTMEGKNRNSVSKESQSNVCLLSGNNICRETKIENEYNDDKLVEFFKAIKKNYASSTL